MTFREMRRPAFDITAQHSSIFPVKRFFKWNEFMYNGFMLRFIVGTIIFLKQVGPFLLTAIFYRPTEDYDWWL